MAKPVKVRRTYRSPRRAEQARANRRTLLDAARDLFIERSYLGTTIQSIADRARLSPATVYGAFGTKRGILSALVDVSIAGDDEPVPILDRPWVAEMQAEPNLGRRVAILAREGTRMLERRWAVDEIVRAAAGTDHEIARLWDQVKSQRFEGQRALLRMAAGRGGEVDPGIADAVYAMGSPETYGLLVHDRGWSLDRFERWYAGAIGRLLGADTKRGDDNAAPSRSGAVGGSR